jgi:hypothetical protein
MRPIGMFPATHFWVPTPRLITTVLYGNTDALRVKQDSTNANLALQKSSIRHATKCFFTY